MELEGCFGQATGKRVVFRHALCPVGLPPINQRVVARMDFVAVVVRPWENERDFFRRGFVPNVSGDAVDAASVARGKRVSGGNESAANRYAGRGCLCRRTAGADNRDCASDRSSAAQKLRLLSRDAGSAETPQVSRRALQVRQTRSCGSSRFFREKETLQVGQ